MRHPASRWSAAAACAAVLLLWLFFPGQQSTANAFNTFANAIVTAKTARFHAEVTIEGQPKQIFKSYYLAPGKYRQEFQNLADVVNIIDFGAKKIVSLAPAQKQATIMNFTGNQPTDASGDWFDRMRELLTVGGAARDDSFERLGEKEIDGKRVIGFRRDTPAATVTMWGDPATGQPVRIENTFSGLPRTEVAMTQFELNVELEPSLFDQTPPTDYKVQSFDVDTSPPTQADLVQGLRTAAELNGGEFLGSLDSAGVQQAIIKSAMKLGSPPTDEGMRLLMKQSLSIGRGLSFVLDRAPAKMEAYYAGKGVKLGASESPILWYKIADQDHYHVIYGDLTVKESPEQPDSPGAVRIEKASRSGPTQP